MLQALWILASAGSLIFAIVTMFQYSLMRLDIPHQGALYIPRAREALAGIAALYAYVEGIIALACLIVGLLYELEIFGGTPHIILGVLNWLLMAAIFLHYYLVDKRVKFLMKHPRDHEIWLTVKPPFKKKQA